ncbi:MAG: hypothetical protein FD123_3163 [Bacteroidetes bacterium]|nr:MAG: hypothetical protein FD123_3163 [Bacteroidota bacterium]
MSEKKKNKVLLIGWDAADWKIIRPLLDSGQMPALQRLVENGVMGNIATLDPPLSPMLWTSIASGMTADRHGILGFAEPDPSTGKVRPVSVTSRKVKAVWNILMQNGYKTHVVGWWPGHPAEPLNGVTVSNFFAKNKKGPGSEMMLAEQAVHPPELSATLEKYRVNPGELTAAHLLPFVPGAAKVDQEKDKSLHAIANLVASGSSYHAVATWILENQDWDFLALYLNEIDVFCHTFMRFYPPQQAGIPDEQYALYNGVIDSAYRFHDMMLERLLELAGEDTTVILVSDHGFHSSEKRPVRLPDDPAAPVYEHSPYGIFCAMGPGIRKDERIYGATLLDIAPTILTIFGLPAGKDMSGRVLQGIFEKPSEIERIESWENISGDSGQHSGEMREDPWAAQEALQQLVELGYLEAPGEDQAEHAKRVTAESQFYLARVFISTNRAEQALPILEKLFAGWPSKLRFGLRLAQTYLRLKRIADARKVIDAVRRDEKVAAQLPSLDFIEGTLLMAEHKPRKALEMLRAAEAKQVRMPGLFLQMGQVYLRLRRWTDAERMFIRALNMDADNAQAHHGLAIASLRQEKTETAIDEALTAVGLLHHFPAAHYHLGEALIQAGDFENAAKAFSVCLSFSPGNRRAHLRLGQLYENQLNDPGKAKEHFEFAAKRIKGVVTVVSGLPRSGTSMIMQMLKAGGMEIVSDGNRSSDDHNPLGYYEDDRVKRLHTDNSWLGEAAGKVVKIVAPLVMNLPPGFQYQVIFAERDMNEVLVSQQRMLGKKEETAKQTFPVALSEAFGKQLEKTKAWFVTQPNVSVHYVRYADIIAQPEEEAENINDFLGGELDSAEMAAAVQVQLYRNRLSAP